MSPCVAQVQSRAHALYAAERTLDGFCATRYTRRPAKKRDLCCPCSPLLIVIGRKCSSLRCCIRLGNWGSTLTRRASAQAFTRSLFLAALVDQLEPNRIRHDHLLTKLAENAARPPLMNAHSYRNQARTQYSQVRFECCRRALYQTFLDYDSVLVQTTMWLFRSPGSIRTALFNSNPLRATARLGKLTRTPCRSSRAILTAAGPLGLVAAIQGRSSLWLHDSCGPPFGAHLKKFLSLSSLGSLYLAEEKFDLFCLYPVSTQERFKRVHQQHLDCDEFREDVHGHFRLVGQIGASQQHLTSPFAKVLPT